MVVPLRATRSRSIDASGVSASRGVLLIAQPLGAGVRVQLDAQSDGTTAIILDHPFLNNNPNALLIVNQWGFNATSGIDVNDDTDRW